MALNIRNPTAEALATQLAKMAGENKTEAITKALQERIDRLRRSRAKRRLADELVDIGRHCASLPVLDKRSTDDILGYNEHGLPR
jgi:antitoxin VapB